MVIPQRWHQSERHFILGEKMKIYPQLLTFFIKPKTWLFHVVVLLTTAKKWTKVKTARAGRAKLLFLPTKYANLWRSRCRRRCRCLSSLLTEVGQLLERNKRHKSIASLPGITWPWPVHNLLTQSKQEGRRVWDLKTSLQQVELKNLTRF